ncbi:MAG TPA: peptide chain release factor N(5)-glutamine methyltransferase [Steroidobacteraceae bacterium]|nr:peptide chain release factor N(5)-glutamine methyltransferase [Steroidobacteraceae bacterium]
MAISIGELLEQGREKLARVADDPGHEAEILLAAALGRNRAYLKAHPQKRLLESNAVDRYQSLLARRACGEPVAYLLGEREFWSLPLEVEPAVLIPRPETELVVERSLGHLPANSASAVLDLAAGSGAIALAIARERPGCRVIGTDCSPAAVRLARRNAERNCLDRVEFRAGDWYEPVHGERFALIASNPPYIAEGDPRVEDSVRRFEPHEALIAGPTGLEALSRVIAGAPEHLLGGGWLVLEHGDLQGADVRGLLAASGFDWIATHRDLAGRERCTDARWPRIASDRT